MRAYKGHKLYLYAICDMSFSHEGNLLIHERSHREEKPHQCSICNKAFSDKKEPNDP